MQQADIMEPPMFTCCLHGALPSTDFYQDDLRMHRHRCKQCVIAAVRCSREKISPLQHMWTNFVKRWRRKRGCRAAPLEVTVHCQKDSCWTSWRKVGKGVLESLLRGVQGSESLEQQQQLRKKYRVVWKEDAQVIALQLIRRSTDNLS